MRDLLITKTCNACRIIFKIEVDTGDYKKWITGAYSCKSCLPYLSDSQICLLLYDICEECYIVKTGDTLDFL